MTPDATSTKPNHATILDNVVEDLTVLAQGQPHAMLSNLKLFGTLGAIEHVGEWLWQHRDELKACLAFLRSLLAEIASARADQDPNAPAPPAA